MRPRELSGLEELFQAYGIRYYTAAKLAELGFTVSTLLDMRDEELEEMMDSLCHIFRWDLLVGERYGIKAARAERPLASPAMPNMSPLMHFLKKQDKEAAGSGGAWDMVAAGGRKVSMKKNCRRRTSKMGSMEDDEEDDSEGAEDDESGGGRERQREHPFIVTEVGEVARGKKNGLDYLFHLYELCREFLIQVQNIARERGEKCPTKVTNQVFRYAKAAGANHINKPKMRHYVHCYALHCLDEAASERATQSVQGAWRTSGAWRQACYMPLVAIAARHGWDIDAVFNSHSSLHLVRPDQTPPALPRERSNATAASSSVTGGGADHLPY
ncbi:hypothetical protein DH2020_013466 [Rehmannia glutinosa]|uniref:Floricaula/leafy-like transcription factor n=1 Tax=Rehmannia glutinosa TaxID=99300 RepID=A0ABR0X2C0_REHGL